MKTLTLPLIFNPPRKLSAAIVMTLVFMTLYSIPNRIHRVPPHLLHLTWVDNWVPFLPWTIWIYTSEYIFIFVMFFMARDWLNLNRYLYAYLFMQIVACMVFWIYPTTYPRVCFPISADVGAWTTYHFNALRSLDTPANCAPSLHVAVCFLTSMIFRHEQREKFWLFFAWSCAITISTLTTKQHYLIDVICGALLALLSYQIFFKKMRYRPSAQVT